MEMENQRLHSVSADPCALPGLLVWEKWIFFFFFSFGKRRLEACGGQGKGLSPCCFPGLPIPTPCPTSGAPREPGAPARPRSPLQLHRALVCLVNLRAALGVWRVNIYLLAEGFCAPSPGRSGLGAVGQRRDAPWAARVTAKPHFALKIGFCFYFYRCQ